MLSQSILTTLSLLSLASAGFLQNFFNGEDRNLQAYPICETQELACANDQLCSGCLMTGTIPPQPVTATTCVDLNVWFSTISFPYPAECDHIMGGNLLSDLIFCRYDSYNYEAGIVEKCIPDTSGYVVPVQPTGTIPPMVATSASSSGPFELPTFAPSKLISSMTLTWAPTMAPTMMDTIPNTMAPTITVTMTDTISPTMMATMAPSEMGL
mmetsp:Transcript_13401/g.19974  ORF Transcript_13401/g.19974 Transcript_13401/m.19974 type:complete len:211 (+) Transcript_13401:50-682(+)|eukprot:CAMPEP_0171462694 /NCGR_PEP_ID=MMETSP0945-20130129/6624_1 /TAXON_ID=109269 /ORGANISM="Vaucheria litorea, Strain CCMP2940" /LENGTH=210 /DNA_ID=CAMNT_0011989261 /DNA_START=41 /DNA_END=673 /DNA_ORIENTATION=-